LAQQIKEQIAKTMQHVGETQEMHTNLWSEPSATWNARDSLVAPADNLHGSLVFKMNILIPGSYFHSN
jgi:hypothetical protein